MFQDVKEYFLKILGRSREVLMSRKLMIFEQNPNITSIFEFSFKSLCSVSQQIKILIVQ